MLSGVTIILATIDIFVIAGTNIIIETGNHFNFYETSKDTKTDVDKNLFRPPKQVKFNSEIHSFV